MDMAASTISCDPLAPVEPPAVAPLAPAPGRRLPIYIGMTEAEVLRVVLIATLEATGGNKLQTARRLGINRRTIYRRLESYAEERA